MSSSKPSDLEMITFNFIRNQYEKQYNQNIPMALKYITLKFSDRIIGCKLLTIKQDMDFFKLLTTKLPSIRRFNFLFRSSDHKYSAEKFHEHCDNKGGTMIIIKSNWGNIFGGYTSKSWKQPQYDYYKRDENAFLFLIKSDDESTQNKCPLLFGIREDEHRYGIRCMDNCGPAFGRGYDLYISDNCDKKVDNISDVGKVKLWNFNYSVQCSYNTEEMNICGGNLTINDCAERYFFQVIDFEVFQIIQ